MFRNRKIWITGGVMAALFLLLIFFVKKREKEPKPTAVVVVQAEKVSGKGALSKPGKKLTVHYEVFLSEGGKAGKKIDSSRDRKIPFDFLVGTGQVFLGWDKVFDGMQVGSYREVVIPASLAYGEAGLKGLVPPKSDLVVQVELLRMD